MPDVNELLDKLKRAAKSDCVRATLDIIHAVCQEQIDHNSTDFSVSTIARLGANKGVPKAQSIRNKTGALYKALIDGWQKANPRDYRPTKVSDKLDWIDSITDPTIRFLVIDLASQNSNLRSELQLLKSITTLEIDMRNQPMSQVEPGFPKLLPAEWEALKAAISDDFIKHHDWTVDQRGKITDENGRTLFRNGFVTALKKITQFHEETHC